MEEVATMKVKRDDTEEARRYWQFLEDNAKIVATWPEWKKGADGETQTAHKVKKNF